MNFPFLYIFNCNFSFLCNFVIQFAKDCTTTFSIHYFYSILLLLILSMSQDCLHHMKRYKKIRVFLWFRLIYIPTPPPLSCLYVSINFDQRLFGSVLFSIPCHVRDFCIMGHDLHEISYRSSAIVGCKKNW